MVGEYVLWYRANLLFFLQTPAELVDLRNPGNSQRISRHIDRHRRTGRNQRITPHRNRRHQLHITADKDIVTNDRTVLIDTVIVAGDGPAADVDIAADLGVPQIGQVRGLRSRTHGDFFGFDKVADLDLIVQDGTRPQMGHGTDTDPDRQLRAFQYRTALDKAIVADTAAVNRYAAFDRAAGADGRCAADPAIGVDDRIGADHNAMVDIAMLRVEQGNPCAHQLVIDPMTQDA